MSDSQLAQHILKKWTAELRSKDRSFSKVQSNFDELFYELWKNKVPFDVTHELIKQAIAAHLPNAVIAKRTYQANKQKLDQTEKEFMDGWQKSIEDVCYQSFYSYYPPQTEANIEEEKKYGNMSAKEYIAQRKYAEQYPVIDIAKLKERWKNGVNTVDEFFDGIDLEGTDDGT